MIDLVIAKQEFKFGHTCAPGTHQPALFTICNKPNLNILEFGCGVFSTPMLAYMASKLNSNIISLETDQRWLDEAKSRCCKVQSHSFLLVSDWFSFLAEDPAKLQQQKWDVVFVDQAPWNARHDTIIAFKNIAEYIVVHDSDMHPGFEFDYTPHLKNYDIYMPAKPYPYKTGPPTLVGSNFNDTKFNINPEDFNQ